MSFHELQLQRAANQLIFMEQHCRDISRHFISIAEVTKSHVPLRGQTYDLSRNFNSNLNARLEERRLEGAIYKEWTYQANDQNQSYAIPHKCRGFATYQMPLYAARRRGRWGAVDLVGVSHHYLPVVVELKTATSNDNPLRMLVEALAYAIAVREAWNNTKTGLRAAWKSRVPKAADTNLVEVPIICLAPLEYWNRRVGEPGPQTNGRVNPEAWLSFQSLVTICSCHGFPVTFAAVNSKNVDGGSPEVSCIRAIELP